MSFEVIAAGVRHVFDTSNAPSRNWRDLGVGVDQARSIQLRLDEGRVFTIPLDEVHRAGGEAAHFVPGLNLAIAVW